MRIGTLSDILREDLDLSDLYRVSKEEEMTPEKKASNLLYDLMLSPGYKGYKYLREALIMLCDDSTEYGSFTKYIYPVIAGKFKTTPQNVEKNIRFAIQKIYKMNSPEELEEKLGKNPIVCSKPSNVKFITFCAEKLRLER